jgi:hypothetical protein
MTPFSVVFANRFPNGLAFHPYPHQVCMISLLSRRWRSSPTSRGPAASNPNLNPPLSHIKFQPLHPRTSPPPNVTTSEIADAEVLIKRVSGACASKAAYATRSEVSTFMRRGDLNGMPYPCQFCGFWHVTTMSKKAQKTLTRKIRAARKLLDSIVTPQ